MNYNKWDVVLLSFPFTDLSAVKVRPAVIVSPEAANRVGEEAVFILITTNISRRGNFDLVVTQSHPEFVETGLRFDSAIRIDKISTLKKRLVVKTLGRLGPLLQGEVEKNLRRFFEVA